MHLRKIQLPTHAGRVMVSLLVLLAALGLRAEDDKSASAPRATSAVKPEASPVTRMPDQLAPEGLFNSSKGPNVRLSIPRPSTIQRTPADQEEIDRRKNWIDQTPEEAFGLKLDDPIAKKNKTGRGMDSEGGWSKESGRLPVDGAGESKISMSIEPPQKRSKVGEATASLGAKRQETAPGGVDWEALLRKSSSVDRFGSGSDGFPGSWQGNSGLPFDAKQKEQRDVHLNEFRQLFESTAVQPGSAAISRSGLENPILDPPRNPSPRAVSEASSSLPAQTFPVDPRLRPTQAGVNRLPSQEVADPRNPVWSQTSGSSLGQSNQEKPKQQPTRLLFPKRVN